MPAPDRSRPALGAVPYVVAGCMFMENLDATVIVTALPAMAHEFRATTATLSFGITAYLIAGAVFLPISNWAADRMGTRTLIACAIALFTLSSLLCGLSGSVGMMIAMRVVQGAAAALMSPSGRAVVLRNVPKAHLVHAVAILTWPSLIAPVLGPPLGGLLTSFASWRWIFLLNVPLGCVGVALALCYIPQQCSAERAPFDAAGLALLGGALAAIILGLQMLGENGAAGGATLAGGVALALMTVRHLRRARHPLVDLAPARVPSFAAAALTGGTLTRIAIGATPFLLPLLFQSALGYSAFAAGATTLLYFAGNLAMKLFTTRLLRRIGFRSILVVNGLLSAAAVAACAALATDLPPAAIALVLLAGGATRSLQFTALNTLAFADIPPAQMGSANVINSVVQQMAMTLGVAIGALALHGGGGIEPGSADFARAFLVVAAIGAIGVLSYIRLAADTGAEVSGRTHR